MTDYITNDTDLTSVANAIRVKAEISGSLEFPSEFISAINSITSGGMTVTRTQDASGGEILTITGEATEIEPLSVTANGTYTAPSGKAYSPVTVNVPQGITPTGTINITENGTVDVTNYASANVNVSGGGGIATRLVTFENNDATAMYYTDATMTAQAITSGSMDISTQMPIGSLVVKVKSGSEPGPYVPTETGVTQIGSHSYRTLEVSIYKVVE